MSRTDDIVGYTYRADNYGPECLLRAMGVRDTVPFGTTGNLEIYLNAVAKVHGIDRADESSYDSGDFPKRLCRDMLANVDASDSCQMCGHERQHHSYGRDVEVGRGQCSVIDVMPVRCPCDEFDGAMADRCSGCGEVLGE